MPSWNVDDALDEVRDTLDGSTPLDVHPDTHTEFRELLRPSFQAQHDAGTDWDQDRPRVLSLVVLVGSYATGLTLGAWGDDLRRGQPHPFPTEVRREDVLCALYFVATQVCVSLMAGYCRGVRPSELPSQGKLDALEAMTGARAEAS